MSFGVDALDCLWTREEFNLTSIKQVAKKKLAFSFDPDMLART